MAVCSLCGLVILNASLSADFVTVHLCNANTWGGGGGGRRIRGLRAAWGRGGPVSKGTPFESCMCFCVHGCLQWLGASCVTISVSMANWNSVALPPKLKVYDEFMFGRQTSCISWPLEISFFPCSAGVKTIEPFAC